MIIVNGLNVGKHYILWKSQHIVEESPVALGEWTLTRGQCNSFVAERVTDTDRLGRTPGGILLTIKIYFYAPLHVCLQNTYAGRTFPGSYCASFN